MAGGFQQRMNEFMRGRNGMDQLNQRLWQVVIVLLIVAIVLSLFQSAFGGVVRVLYTLVNLASIVGLAYLFFRMFSRNTSARQTENQRYLERSRARGKKAAGGTGGRAAKGQDRSEYKYLKCQFCGQEMRVPRGKGKIAVKCPKCDEKTIIES